MLTIWNKCICGSNKLNLLERNIAKKIEVIFECLECKKTFKDIYSYKYQGRKEIKNNKGEKK